jgi:hypothetical protein
MKHPLIKGILCLGAVIASAGSVHASDPTGAASTVPKTDLDDAPPRMLSAFFGLDNRLPPIATLFHPEAPGKDGMPVTFTRRVMGGPSVDPTAFTVRTKSGALHQPLFATLAPASAPGKDHTVLLIGEFGDAASDPPVSVEVTGDLPLEYGANAKGLSAAVTPLADGPTLMLALAYRPEHFACDAPLGTRQIVVAIWAGGVKPKPGADEAAHLAGYRVSTKEGEVRPVALGSLKDNDNYVCLFLASDAPAERVTFAAGIVVDPNGDVNPETSATVHRSK